jgi:hypothetical protein
MDGFMGFTLRYSKCSLLCHFNTGGKHYGKQIKSVENKKKIKKQKAKKNMGGANLQCSKA